MHRLLCAVRVYIYYLGSYYIYIATNRAQPRQHPPGNTIREIARCNEDIWSSNLLVRARHMQDYSGDVRIAETTSKATSGWSCFRTACTTSAATPGSPSNSELVQKQITNNNKQTNKQTSNRAAALRNHRRPPKWPFSSSVVGHSLHQRQPY